MEFENLLTLIKTVSDSELTGLKYEENGVKLQLSKRQGKICVSGTSVQTQEPAVSEVNIQTEKAASDTAISGKVIESPLVGTFYAASSEGAEPFAPVGSVVKKGQTLGIVEAMKLMNEIESDYEGTIAEVYVENGQAVEYGQPLFRIS